MGLISLVIRIAVALVVLLAAVGGIAYATDYGVEATVVKKDCAAGTLTVQAKLVPIQYTAKDIPFQTCAVVQNDNFVTYHVRTQRTSLYESEGGPCLYDTVGGPAGCPA